MKEGIKNKDRFAKRIRTKRLLMIAFLSLFLTSYSLIVAQNTTEREQQFTYYWYAAKQAIVEERYNDAYVLLKFCHALNPDDGTTMRILGIIEQGIGNEMRGLIYFRDAFAADPYDGWFQYAKALKAMNTPAAGGEYMRVLEKAHEVQRRSSKPVDEDLLTQLQEAYLTTGQWQKALAIQDEIDQLKGYDAYSAVLRYRVYDAVNKPKKAMAEVERYLKQDPTDIRFILFKLELMEKTKTKRKDLYATYERAIELDPYNMVVLNNYAYHLATHGGDLQKAEAMSAITIRQDPDNPVFLDTYGWILHLQGQDELAKFYLMKAMQNETEETSEDIRKHYNAIK